MYDNGTMEERWTMCSVYCVHCTSYSVLTTVYLVQCIDGVTTSSLVWHDRVEYKKTGVGIVIFFHLIA